MTTEREARLEEALKQIAEHWGELMPLSSPDKVLIRKWMKDYRTLQNIAREVLGMGKVG